MIIVDTNVISELMLAKPDAKVMAWADAQPIYTLMTTAITAAELLAGAERLPIGKRRTAVEAKIEAIFIEGFHGRVLPFDEKCAPHYARIFAGRLAIGKPIKEPDAMIAAVCVSRGYKIATRDLSGFSNCGIEIINPWAD